MYECMYVCDLKPRLVYGEAGGDGRLAGHFAKLAELERPATAWEAACLRSAGLAAKEVISIYIYTHT